MAGASRARREQAPLSTQTPAPPKFDVNIIVDSTSGEIAEKNTSGNFYKLWN